MTFGWMKMGERTAANYPHLTRFIPLPDGARWICAVTANPTCTVPSYIAARKLQPILLLWRRPNLPRRWIRDH